MCIPFLISFFLIFNIFKIQFLLMIQLIIQFFFIKIIEMFFNLRLNDVLLKPFILFFVFFTKIIKFLFIISFPLFFFFDHLQSHLLFVFPPLFVAQLLLDFLLFFLTYFVHQILCILLLFHQLIQLFLFFFLDSSSIASQVKCIVFCFFSCEHLFVFINLLQIHFI